MLALGIIFILFGLLLPGLHVLFTIGVILAIVGAVFYILGSTGRPVGGHRHWY